MSVPISLLSLRFRNRRACAWRISKHVLIIDDFQGCQEARIGPYYLAMKTAFILFVHAIVTIARLLRPGGAKSLIAENLAVRHQLIIANRTRKRAPNLTTLSL